jgi:hypothetical protein
MLRCTYWRCVLNHTAYLSHLSQFGIPQRFTIGTSQPVPDEWRLRSRLTSNFNSCKRGKSRASAAATLFSCK